MKAGQEATVRITCVLFLLVTSIITTHATQLRQLSIEEMGQTATKVVQGKVLSTQSYWNSDHTKILTEITVSGDVTHKGTADGLVRIVQLGGTVDNVRVNVHGSLGWTPGEEVLLFLESYRDGAFVVTGLSQGKFKILRDERSGEVYVSRTALAGVEMDGGHGDVPPIGTIAKTPLSEFLDQALGTGAGR